MAVRGFKEKVAEILRKEQGESYVPVAELVVVFSPYLDTLSQVFFDKTLSLTTFDTVVSALCEEPPIVRVAEKNALPGESRKTTVLRLMTDAHIMDNVIRPYKIWVDMKAQEQPNLRDAGLILAPRGANREKV